MFHWIMPGPQANSRLMPSHEAISMCNWKNFAQPCPLIFLEFSIGMSSICPMFSWKLCKIFIGFCNTFTWFQPRPIDYNMLFQQYPIPTETSRWKVNRYSPSTFPPLGPPLARRSDRDVAMTSTRPDFRLPPSAPVFDRQNGRGGTLGPFIGAQDIFI